MNFEDAFKHYQDGVATPEEKEYVKKQLDELKSFSALMDDEGINVTPAPIAEADRNDLKKVKKQLKAKYVIIPICVVAFIICAIAAILGGVFGYASSSAKKAMKFSKGECIQIARQYAYDFTKDKNGLNLPLAGSVDDFWVKEGDADIDFVYNGNELKKSFYVYVIEVNTVGCEFEIRVDTRTGKCDMLDIDIGR